MARLSKRRVDDSECQVEQEEGAEQNDENEVNEHIGTETTPYHDHNVTPTFERNTLEHIEEGVRQVVEVCDTEIGVR